MCNLKPQQVEKQKGNKEEQVFKERLVVLRWHRRGREFWTNTKTKTSSLDKMIGLDMIKFLPAMTKPIFRK